MPWTTEAQQRYLQKRRAKAREYLGGMCMVCGIVNDLHFDHIDPKTKVTEIAEAITRHWSWTRLMTELDKCQLLCSVHHREKSSRNGDDGSVPHGGGVSGKRNCPCPLCKTRKAEYMVEYKRKRNLPG